MELFIIIILLVAVVILWIMVSTMQKTLEIEDGRIDALYEKLNEVDKKLEDLK